MAGGLQVLDVADATSVDPGNNDTEVRGCTLPFGNSRGLRSKTVSRGSNSYTGTCIVRNVDGKCAGETQQITYRQGPHLSLCEAICGMFVSFFVFHFVLSVPSWVELDILESWDSAF